MHTLQICLWGLETGALYGLIALAVVIIYKATKVLNIAQGAIVMMCAYLSYTVTSQEFLPMWAGILLSVGVAAALGLLLDRAFMRPLVGQPILSLIMVTIALMALFNGLATIFWGEAGGWRFFDPPIIAKGSIEIGEILLLKQQSVGFIVAIVLFGLCMLFFKYAKLGLGMRATAEDHQVAKVLGVPVMFVFASTWALATIISVAGGIVLGHINGINLGMSNIGLKALACSLIGGLDSIPGALLAGLMVGVLEMLAGAYIDPLVGGGLMDIFPFIVMIIIIYFRPYGFFGLERIERV